MLSISCSLRPSREAISTTIIISLVVLLLHNNIICSSGFNDLITLDIKIASRSFNSLFPPWTMLGVMRQTLFKDLSREWTSALVRGCGGKTRLLMLLQEENLQVTCNIIQIYDRRGVCPKTFLPGFFSNNGYF